MTEEEKIVLRNYRNRLGRRYRMAQEAKYSCVDWVGKYSLQTSIPLVKHYLERLNA